MAELLAKYSVEQIIIFIGLLFVAFKEVCDMFDYIKQKGLLWFKAEQKQEQNDNVLQQLVDKIDNIDNQIKILMESDRDDIKSWLVEKYNFYKENPTRPISHHTMDTIEKRYSHYKDEGGNSYIDNTIMPELRRMAKEEQRVKL